MLEVLGLLSLFPFYNTFIIVTDIQFAIDFCSKDYSLLSRIIVVHNGLLLNTNNISYKVLSQLHNTSNTAKPLIRTEE